MVFGTASEAQVQPLIQEAPALGPGGADTRPNSAGGGLESWGGFLGPSLQPRQPPAAPRLLPAALWKLAREDEAGSGVEAVLDLMQILSHPHPTPQGFPKQPRGPGIPVQACSPAGLWSGVPTPRTGGWVSYQRPLPSSGRGALRSALPFLWASLSTSKGHSRPPQRFIRGRFSGQTENPSRLRVREKSLL